MGLSALPEFTYWLPRRLKIYSHVGILRHNHSVHSIDCNNKLVPFRDCTFYYQQNKTRKEILPEFTDIHHPWYSVLFPAADMAIRLLFGWFPKRPGWFCCVVTCPCQGCDKSHCTSTTVFGQKRWFLDGGCETDTGSASPRGEQCKCPGFVLEPTRAGMRWEELSIILQRNTVISLNM